MLYTDYKVLQECKREGLDSEVVLPIMEVPYEWTGTSFLFDFDTMPPETLAKYINYLFKHWGFHLNEGTILDGIYLNRGGNNSFPRSMYKYQVEIYSNDGKTYLKTHRVFKGWHMALNKILYGEYYLDYGLNKLAGEIKYLKPSVTGYLICDKCGSYYEIKEGESADDYNTNCECGGTLKFIHNIEQPDREHVFNPRKFQMKENLNFIILALSSVLIICFVASISNVFPLALMITIFMVLLVLLILTVKIRRDY
jgi:hypothetical protein